VRTSALLSLLVLCRCEPELASTLGDKASPSFELDTRARDLDEEGSLAAAGSLDRENRLKEAEAWCLGVPGGEDLLLCRAVARASAFKERALGTWVGSCETDSTITRFRLTVDRVGQEGIDGTSCVDRACAVAAGRFSIGNSEVRLELGHDPLAECASIPFTAWEGDGGLIGADGSFARYRWEREGGLRMVDWPCHRSDPDLEEKLEEIADAFRECGSRNASAARRLARLFAGPERDRLGCFLLDPRHEGWAPQSLAAAVGLGFAAFSPSAEAGAICGSSFYATTSPGCEAFRRYSRSFAALDEGLLLPGSDQTFARFDLAEVSGEICRGDACNREPLWLHLPILVVRDGARFDLWTGDWSER
jgi:hypothetical protein